MSRRFSDFSFGWKPGWTARAPFRPAVDDSRFSDEEILTILHAGEAGLKIEALCTAGDIPVETYYVWKAKYTGLSPAQLRERRSQERRKKRNLTVALTAVSAVVVALAVAYPFIPAIGTRSAPAKARPAPRKPAAARKTVPKATADAAAAAVTSGTTTPPPAPPPPAPPTATAPNANVAQAPVPAATGAPPKTSAPTPPRAEGEPVNPNGVSVQVSAVAKLADARVAMERLAALGYRPFMTTTVVNNVEMYRVRVGPFESRAAAEDAARRLTKEGFGTPWVTK